MNNKWKRIIISFFCLITMLCALPTCAFAAGSIDLSRNGSVTISYQDEGKALSGVDFSIYLVATTDQYGRLTITKEFENYNVNIGDQNNTTTWITLASTLEGYVLRDKLNPIDTEKTGIDGIARFPSENITFVPGLYLITSSKHSQNGYSYDSQPFMVMLPSLDKSNNCWLYDVSVSPKFEKRQEDNPHDNTITRKVLKVWEDDGHENKRPKEVFVQLLRDGEVYSSVTLNEENSWRYLWDNLSNKHSWTIVEQEVDGYTVEVTREGKTFVVTNTYSETNPDNPQPSSPNPSSPTKPTLPQTGLLWWPVPILFMGGMLLVVLGLIYRRGRTNEKQCR